MALRRARCSARSRTVNSLLDTSIYQLCDRGGLPGPDRPRPALWAGRLAALIPPLSGRAGVQIRDKSRRRSSRRLLALRQYPGYDVRDRRWPVGSRLAAGKRRRRIFASLLFKASIAVGGAIGPGRGGGRRRWLTNPLIQTGLFPYYCSTQRVGRRQRALWPVRWATRAGAGVEAAATRLSVGSIDRL